jgi:hypothetical protein
VCRIIDNTSKIITIENVMDMLDISSKKTIYTYIQRGKWTYLSSDRVNDKTFVFTMEFVVLLL